MQRRHRLGGIATERRVLAGEHIQIRDGRADGMHACRLLPHRRGHGLDDARHLLHAVQQSRHGPACLSGHLSTGINTAGRPFDEGAHLARGSGGARCEVAHFVGHYGKPPPRIPRPCSLYRSVERKDVGLKRDVVDQADDLANLARAACDAAHGFHQSLDHLCALLRLLQHAVGDVMPPLGIVGIGL